MASKISLTLETSDAHDAALAWLLKKTNGDREANFAKPHPGVPEMLTAMVVPILDTILTDHQAMQGTCIRDALLTATPDECAKIAEILRIEWP